MRSTDLQELLGEMTRVGDALKASTVLPDCEGNPVLRVELVGELSRVDELLYALVRSGWRVSGVVEISGRVYTEPWLDNVDKKQLEELWKSQG
jgi:hypothetical protein